METKEEITLMVDISTPKLEKNFREVLKLIDGMRVIWAETGEKGAYVKGIKTIGDNQREVIVDVVKKQGEYYVHISTWDMAGVRVSEWKVYFPENLWRKIYKVIKRIENEITERVDKKFENIKVKFE